MTYTKEKSIDTEKNVKKKEFTESFSSKNLDVKTQKGLCAELESVQRAAYRIICYAL